MKEILTVIRMNMILSTKRALSNAGIMSMTAKEALGRGKGMVDLSLLKGAEKGYEEAISQLGQTQRLIPKRILFCIVPDKLVKKTIKTIIKINQTGKSGDGKIFVMPISDSINVRMGARGDMALDEA